ncbi:MAG: nucleotidyl transferase AbiEii/AbiGii toxin family protein [Candidatus Brocadiales bacterium]|nr:nucleotidyl transferase AbiEii/AbiGii toxin family protein [Candidatus Brocadiales bacterium]
MISHQEIKNLVIEWGLREAIIEKDYVIGWLLWGLGSDSDLKNSWAFKGGTSLKKCYVETWRFSEDLDFTVLPDGPASPDVLEPIIKRVLDKVHDESGIDFSVAKPKFKYFDRHNSTQGSVYYRGPRNAPSASRIKLDISGIEKVARPTVLRTISHSYSDTLPDSSQVRCYAFEEVFAEKLRAMGERGRPRDLYDIVLLSRRRDLQFAPGVIKTVLEDKCRSKNVPYPTLESIQNAQSKAELVSEWENMLGHQLQALPPFEGFWEEIPNILNWLEGVAEPVRLASIGAGKDEDLTWAPPPTIWQWGVGVPLESIRFAAVNHLCVELGYRKESGEYTSPVIEPYSVRRTQEGNLVLRAVKAQTGEPRSYRVDRIKNIKVSTKTFRPRYEIEFSVSGSIRSQPTTRKRKFDGYGSSGVLSKLSSRSRSVRRSPGSFGMKYIFQCGLCGKKFTRSKYDSRLRKHKNTYGMNCSGRSGIFLGNK